MAQFKEQYQNSIVTVKAQGIGRVTINTSDSDPNKWAKIPEFHFMLDGVECKTEAKEIKMVEPKKEGSSPKKEYEDYSLKELREMFPDIKATSQKKFIEQIK